MVLFNKKRGSTGLPRCTTKLSCCDSFPTERPIVVDALSVRAHQHSCCLASWPAFFSFIDRPDAAFSLFATTISPRLTWDFICSVFSSLLFLSISLFTCSPYRFHMASNHSRQSKPPRKVQEGSRRSSAWTGARATSTFSPGPNSSRLPNASSAANQAGFPSLSNGGASQERLLQSLAGLTGMTITLTTKTAICYEGVIRSTGAEGDTTGVTLRDVKEISNPGAPLRDSIFVALASIESWNSGPADAKAPNGDSFSTDTDISQKLGIRRERELQAWQGDSDPSTGVDLGGSHGDDITFGPSSNNASWDQFAANEAGFGVVTSFDEELYTTKLDRSAPDYKEREKKAQRIANEIMGTATNNPHIAEERNMTVDDSGVDEEDKYGAVVRGSNAYIPPGARRQQQNAASASKPEVPKPVTNTSDPAPPPTATQPPVVSKEPTKDAIPAFRDFVVNEKNRLTQRRAAMVKTDMEKRVADLVSFSKTFKLNKPIPEDLVSILAKDEERQKQIREKSSQDASSAQARSIGAPGSAAVAAAARLTANANAAPVAKTKAVSPTPQAKPSIPVSKSATSAVAKVEPKKNGIYIQPIPPFKGPKRAGAAPVANGTAAARPTVATSQSQSGLNGAAGPLSPNAVNRLNVNASSFMPNPKSPVPSDSRQAAPSPRPSRAAETTSTSNPFFGRAIKKSLPVHVKDDFNPFKHNKVVEASQVAANWPYNGKRYMLAYPPAPHQQTPTSTHNQPSAPPPMQPPPYEEDPAAQAAPRPGGGGYVFAYPAYGYPQPIMPGMPHPGPPGAYMHGPFMQPMGYPPNMPPPPGQPMYASPSMAHMPPSQVYMAPPPMNNYPPPNGGGQRPSMPPTPIPSHTHAYYHQSPQLQHAVPYPMMMPPPPNGQPAHPYDGTTPAPPIPMGGHA